MTLPGPLVPFATTTLLTRWVPLTLAETVEAVLWWRISDPSTAATATWRPYYRLNPSVYAWARRQLATADDAAHHGESGTPELRAAVAALAGRWRPLAEWAEGVYGVEELAAARAVLPRLPETAVAVAELMRLGELAGRGVRTGRLIPLGEGGKRVTEPAAVPVGWVPAAVQLPPVGLGRPERRRGRSKVRARGGVGRPGLFGDRGGRA
jgi:hypothetical protein